MCKICVVSWIPNEALWTCTRTLIVRTRIIIGVTVHYQLFLYEYVIFIDQMKTGWLPIVFVLVSSFPDSWLRSFIPVIIHVYYYSSMISWSLTSDDLCRPTPSNQVQSHSYSESVLSLAQNPNHHITSQLLALCQPITSQLLALYQPIRIQRLAPWQPIRTQVP